MTTGGSPDWRLPTDYAARSQPEYFNDAPNHDSDVVHQPDIYALAEYLVETTGRSTVLDIGCGSARKLLTIRAPRRVGLDYAANIATCRAHTPAGTWFEIDLENGQFPEIPDFVAADTVVINSDVIEHLKDPSNLLGILAQLHHAGAIVLLSTPDRLRSRGPAHRGPPGNPAHVREWALAELVEVLAEHGLPAAFSGYTISNTRRWMRNTILTIHDQSLARSPPTVGAKAPLIACLPTQWAESTRHRALLEAHGIECRVADATGVARMKVDEADRWFVEFSAEELPCSPWRELGLAEALSVVAAAGYDAVSFSPLLSPEPSSLRPRRIRGNFASSSERTRSRTMASLGAAVPAVRRMFPYRFHSIVWNTNLDYEPRRAGLSAGKRFRAAMSAWVSGPGEHIDTSALLETYLAERLSDVSARRADFLSRLEI